MVLLERREEREWDEATPTNHQRNVMEAAIANEAPQKNHEVDGVGTSLPRDPHVIDKHVKAVPASNQPPRVIYM